MHCFQVNLNLKKEAE